MPDTLCRLAVGSYDILLDGKNHRKPGFEFDMACDLDC